MKIDLIAATSNKNKISEFNRYFSPYKVLPIVDHTAPDEIYNDYLANARLKVDYYSQFYNGIIFAEDAGFEVHSLNNAPGIYSARYAEDPQSRIDKVLSEVNGLERKARFVSVICCKLKEGQYLVATGEISGTVSNVAKGESGWGYEPIFELTNGLTIAEHRDKGLDFTNHRKIACNNLLSLLLNIQ